MPRTRARKKGKTKSRNSDEDNLDHQLKELQRIHDEFEIETAMVWQQQMEEIHEIIHKYRSRFGPSILEMTMGELANCKASSTSLVTSAHESLISNDDGYDTQVSSHLSRPKKRLEVNPKKHGDHGQSSKGMTNLSAESAQTPMRKSSRSRYRTPCNRLQNMSADRAVMKTITPKIQMNTPVSLLRYPKVGETIISMCGSPVIVNGGATHNVANINIPIADGMFSMQPNAITRVDSDLVSHIDNDTLSQLKQLQANLAVVMSTVNKIKK